ncbi:hypothetical protein DSO57_1017222 [Entomophthora muscae]|uniref:Uncharacterized protein n=1 Tax=Entomophthora muscae TaxID=34485 RepID=A0ACC2U338_9FUNG|nr:hypothetical protein DSO57_1017222 [Entomophthora muscae]
MKWKTFPMTPLLLLSYNHSRAGMVILTILSLAKVIIPNLGAYRPLAAGLLYLTRSAPFLYWALVTRYLDGFSSPLMPWDMTATSHDNECHFNICIENLKLKPRSQGKPYVDQSRQETSQLPVGSNPGPPEIDDPNQEEQKPANLPSVNTGGSKSTLETLESNPDPPKTTQDTQSGQKPTNLINCKPKLTSYSKTRQSPKDNSPNGHQIATNLVPPKIQNYAEVVAYLKEVKTKPTANSANDCQQLSVFRPE